jgi:hypothetical protein
MKAILILLLILAAGYSGSVLDEQIQSDKGVNTWPSTDTECQIQWQIDSLNSNTGDSSTINYF